MSKLIDKISKLETQLQKNYETLNTIEISKSAILNNFDLLSRLNKNFEVFPVLKSNAYGHGLEQVAEILRDRSFPYIVADGYFEALRIRKVSPQPILIMGVIKPENYKRIKKDSFAFVVGDFSQLDTLGKLNRRIIIHIDINTGMNRQGFDAKDLSLLMKKLNQYKRLQVEGIMTHFADADNPKSVAYNKQQIQKYDSAVKSILDAGVRPAYFHIANSAGSVKQQSKYCNAIRPGFALYGLNPLQSKDPYYRRYSKLRPALQVVSSVVKVISLEPGDCVSYGCTFTAKRNGKVAVVPFGYYEGLPRELSSVGWAKHGKSWLRIAGRVCMNHTILDIGQSRIRLWDKIVLVSSDSQDRNSVRQICRNNRIFDYELIVGFSESVRREVVY